MRIGVAYERFGILAGAWWLEARCQTLAVDERKIFERDLAVVNVSLATSLDSNSMVLGIQLSAKKAADGERYAKCNDEVKEIVKFAYVVGREWSAEIRRAVLGSTTGLPDAKK